MTLLDHRAYIWLYNCATDRAIINRWRLAGHTPPISDFIRWLWHDVSAQFVIEETSSSQRVGLVQLYGVDYRNGFGILSVLFAREYWSTIWPFEAVILFVDWVFARSQLRRIYLEMPQSTIDLFGASIANVSECALILQSQRFFEGGYEDVTVRYLEYDQWFRISWPRSWQRMML